MYRFPFSLTDHPKGWLEITDVCNISCRGCYRSRIGGHRPLDVLRDEIRLFREERNCDSISLAGGEPTTHPEVLTIAKMVREHGMKCVVVTNGVKLDHALLSRLRDAGVTHVGIHVDSCQIRPGWTDVDEVALCELRQRFADMAEAVGGVCCNFVATIYRENLRQVPHLVHWARDNIGKVAGMVFITYRAVPVSDAYRYVVGDQEVDPRELGYVDTDLEAIGVTPEDVAAAIAEADPAYQPAAYLSGTLDHRTNKWLISVRVGRKGRVYGYLGPRTMELTQAFHHLLRGRYLLFMPSNRKSPMLLGLGAIDRSFRPAIRRAVRDAVRHPIDVARPLYTQALTIVRAPDMVVGDGANMCDGCPDITVHDGQLVHSCRLDELRKWGGYMTVHERRSAPSDPPSPA
jgi:hypothetical protein